MKKRFRKKDQSTATRLPATILLLWAASVTACSTRCHLLTMLRQWLLQPAGLMDRQAVKCTATSVVSVTGVYSQYSVMLQSVGE